MNAFNSCLKALLLAVSTIAHAGEVSPLVDAGAAVPGLEVRMRYAGSDNFTGRPVPGYEAPRCLLTTQATAALELAAQEAARHGLSLVVFDCYRPQRAVDQFMRWTAQPDNPAIKETYYPNVAKSALVAEGYIAEKSGHSRGSTLDLTLARTGGDLLDMGTPWDFFDALSWTETPLVSESAKANRLLLRSIMENNGFSNYAQEWWHYRLRDEPLTNTSLDVPVR